MQDTRDELIQFLRFINKQKVYTRITGRVQAQRKQSDPTTQAIQKKWQNPYHKKKQGERTDRRHHTTCNTTEHDKLQ